MTNDEFSRIGVVGGGLMGNGIAEVCARAGREVTVVEVSSDAAAAARGRLEKSLGRAAARERITDREYGDALASVRYVTDIAELGQSDLVVEAVAEDEDAKIAVFSRLDTVVENQDAVLATNTSSIPVMKLGMATTRPGHVVGLHFFNPVPVLALVELVPSLLTSSDVQERAEAFAAEVLNKTVIHCKDRAGFIVNAMLVPYILSAVRMHESGYATAADIDAGMVQGCAHPMGPLQLADLIGLDTVAAIADSLYAEFKEPLYSPPPALRRMVDAGLLGRKSGRGFHEYA